MTALNFAVASWCVRSSEHMNNVELRTHGSHLWVWKLKTIVTDDDLGSGKWVAKPRLHELLGDFLTSLVVDCGGYKKVCCIINNIQHIFEITCVVDLEINSNHVSQDSGLSEGCLGNCLDLSSLSAPQIRAFCKNFINDSFHVGVPWICHL